MTNLEMIEFYKQFCLAKGIKQPGIISRINSEGDTLGDILSSIYGQGFRAGKDQGWDEGRAYGYNEQIEKHGEE